jgi:hypothetical protein
MNTLRLNASVGCLIFGLMLSGAKAADCDGAITADEALKAEDARYAAQASSDFDAMGRLYGDDLVYVHSSAVIDSKASYVERAPALRPALSGNEAEQRQGARIWLPCNHHWRWRL